MRKLYFLIIILFLFFNVGFAQNLNKIISINVNNASFKDVLAQISKAAAVDFAYNPSILPNSKLFDINEKQKPLAYILGGILISNQLTYKIIENQIIIIPAKNKITNIKTDKQVSPLR